jgi:hypothetical protein
MIKKCAYCGKENVNFTKEHVYPKCLYERTPEQNLSYSPQLEKIIEAEATIKDVCSDCNNGELSKLDSYFCNLFDHHFKNFVYQNDFVVFEYDFDMLARSLLKISYNSARASKTDYESLANYTDYILHNVNRPDGLVIFVQLIIPYQMTSKELETFPRASELKDGMVLPTSTRAGAFELRRGTHRFRPGRMFSINSYYFFVCIHPEEVPEKLWKKLISNMPSLIPGATQLKSFKRKAIIKASNVNFRDANWSLTMQSEKTYLAWKANKRNK